MGLRSWWKRFRIESAQLDVEDLCREYIHEKDAIQPYYQFKKQVERECFPKAGDDLLAKKEMLINALSSREREFQEKYVSDGSNIFDEIKSQVSRNNEQAARLVAHQKWQKLLFYSRSQGRIHT